MADRKLNIYEAKTHLSREIARLRPGDRLVLCNRNKPVAELRPIITRKVRLGLARGEFSVPEEFFDELPAEILAGFEGEG